MLASLANTKVNGSAIVMAKTEPKPGKAPMIMPIAVPNNTASKATGDISMAIAANKLSTINVHLIIASDVKNHSVSMVGSDPVALR